MTTLQIDLGSSELHRCDLHSANVREISIDPVRHGQSSSAFPDRLQARLKPSFVAVRGLEIRQSVPVAGDLLQFRMAIVRVRQAKLADFG